MDLRLTDDPRVALARLRKAAAKRMAEAPDYPDHPDDIAERDAIAEALMAGQSEAMASIDEEARG